MVQRPETDGSGPGEGVPGERHLTAAQVAARWQVDRSSVYRAAARSNGLPSIKIGGARRFRLADVLAFEELHTVRPGAGSRLGRLLGGA